VLRPFQLAFLRAIDTVRKPRQRDRNRAASSAYGHMCALANWPRQTTLNCSTRLLEVAGADRFKSF